MRNIQDAMPALDLYCGTQKTIRGQKSAWWKRRVAECQPCPEFLEARFWPTSECHQLKAEHLEHRPLVPKKGLGFRA